MIRILFILLLLSSTAYGISVQSSNADTIDGLDSTYFLNRVNHTGIEPNSGLSGPYTGITKVGDVSTLNVSGTVNIGVGDFTFGTGSNYFGVGSALPSNYIDINASSGGFMRLYSSTAEIGVILERTNGSSVDWKISNDSGNLRFSSATNGLTFTPRVFFRNDGYIGINTTSPQRQFSVNGDALIVGNLHVTGNIYESNFACGGFFVSGNATVTVISSTAILYDVTKNAQTCTVMKNMTHSAGVITVGVSGTYEVEVIGNIDQKTPADDIHLYISKNNSSNPSWEFLSDTLDVTISSQPIACHGIFQLNANDTLRLKVQNVTGARNVGIENVNFKVTRIAPL